jgi:hypothetical protein
MRAPNADTTALEREIAQEANFENWIFSTLECLEPFLLNPCAKRDPAAMESNPRISTRRRGRQSQAALHPG